MTVRGSIFFALASALLGGCTQLPVDGPRHRDITDCATATLLSDRRAIALDYALVDINSAVLAHAIDVGPGSFFRTFGKKSGPPPIIRVGTGDVVQVSVFESSAGGLFIPAEA